MGNYRQPGLPKWYQGFAPIDVRSAEMPIPQGYNWMADYTPYQSDPTRAAGRATERPGKNSIGVKWPWEEDPETQAHRNSLFDEGFADYGSPVEPTTFDPMLMQATDPAWYQGFDPIDVMKTPDQRSEIFGLPTGGSVTRRPDEDDEPDPGGGGGGEGTGTGSGTGSGVGTGSGSGIGSGSGSGSGSGTGGGSDPVWIPGYGWGHPDAPGTEFPTRPGAPPPPQRPDDINDDVAWDDFHAAFDEWWNEWGIKDDTIPDEPGGGGEGSGEPGGGGGGSAGSGGGTGGGTGGGAGAGGDPPVDPNHWPGGIDIPDMPDDWEYQLPTEVQPGGGISGGQILEGIGSVFGGGGSGSMLMPGEWPDSVGGAVTNLGSMAGGRVGAGLNLLGGIHSEDPGTNIINGLATVFGPGAYVAAIPSFVGNTVDNARVDSGERSNAGALTFNAVGDYLMSALRDPSQAQFVANQSVPQGRTTYTDLDPVTGMHTDFWTDFARSVTPSANPHTGEHMNAFYQMSPQELLKDMIEFYNANPNEYVLDPTDGSLLVGGGFRGTPRRTAQS